MAQKNDELEKWAMDVISGKARGVGPSALRIFLRSVAVLYKVGVKTRLRLFRKGWKQQHDLGTMVVSIGNLTMGELGRRRWLSALRENLPSEAGRSLF